MRVAPGSSMAPSGTSGAAHGEPEVACGDLLEGLSGLLFRLGALVAVALAANRGGLFVIPIVIAVLLLTSPTPLVHLG